MAQSAISYSSFAKPNNILDAPITESFTTYSRILIVSSLILNPKPIVTLSAFIAALIISTQAPSSNVKAHENRYKHGGGVKLSTISSEIIVITHSKTFVKTEDLAYFSKIKKHSKV